MKKTLLVTSFFIFCFSPLVVMAEHSAVDRGSFELGVGNIIDIWLYRSDYYEDATWIGLCTTPDLTVGYFMLNRFMIGTTLGFSSFKSESWAESDNAFFIQPAVKYYLPVSEKVLFNVKGFFGWSRTKYAGDADTYTQIRYGGGAAVTYLFHPKLGASIGADFIVFPNQKISGTEAEGTSYDVFDILLGLSVYL